METVYDWVSVALFAALIVLFLNRSSMDNPPDTIWMYMPPSIGCAAANYFGNEGHDVLGILLLLAVVVYIFALLKPRILR